MLEQNIPFKTVSLCHVTYALRVNLHFATVWMSRYFSLKAVATSAIGLEPIATYFNHTSSYFE